MNFTGLFIAKMALTKMSESSDFEIGFLEVACEEAFRTHFVELTAFALQKILESPNTGVATPKGQSN